MCYTYKKTHKIFSKKGEEVHCPLPMFIVFPQIMESLWESITYHKGEYISPTWHEQALKETEAAFSDGKEKMVDWKKPSMSCATFLYEA
jgi:hypothetical protein